MAGGGRWQIGRQSTANDAHQGLSVMTITTMAMRHVVLLTILLQAVLSPALLAGERERQVESARVAAEARLMELIEREPLGRGVAVGDFLSQLGASDGLSGLLPMARTVGGIRWIDEQTCQVRVELPGDKVGQYLLDLALAQPNRVALPYGTLETRVSQWKRRSFSATGSSLAWERAQVLPPPAWMAGWRSVDDSGRRAALLAAREEVRRMLLEERLMPASDDEQGRQNGESVELLSVSAVQFHEDRSVEVAFAVSSVNGEGRPTPRILTGRARVPSAGGATTQMAVIPAPPPRWVDSLLQATAESETRKTPLQTARAAQSAAELRLGEQITGLPLPDGTTIGAASAKDASLAAAVERAVGRARVSRIEYRADGSVFVQVSLAGDRLWREIMPHVSGRIETNPSASE